jgi:hypothetical protein
MTRAMCCRLVKPQATLGPPGIGAAPSLHDQPIRGDVIKTRKQALLEEFDDLVEQYFCSGSREERCRCAGRMGAILAELEVL